MNVSAIEYKALNLRMLDLKLLNSDIFINFSYSNDWRHISSFVRLCYHKFQSIVDTFLLFGILYTKTGNISIQFTIHILFSIHFEEIISIVRMYKVSIIEFLLHCLFESKEI